MLILIRGLPGSGKSTLAQRCVEHRSLNYLHLETDQFFMDNGVYVYDPSRIKEAHTWCQQETKAALKRGQNVVVSNTFTQYWELEPYLTMAQDTGHSVRVLRCTGTWGHTKPIPQTVLERMTERFEDYPGETYVR